MKNRKRNLLLIAGISGAVLCWMLLSDGAGNIWRAIVSASPAWLLAACGLMGAYWLLETQVLHLAVRKFHAGHRFGASLKTSMIGQLFNCITPFASGGQPVQAYHLVKSGVPLGAASCALMVKFIVYQTILTFYSLTTLILRFGMFRERISGLGFLVLVGFGVNAAVIAGLLCICFFRRATRRFVTAVIGLLARVRLVKDPQKALEHMDRELEGFYGGFSAMRGNLPLICGMALLTAVQLTAFFLIPWTLYRSFGLQGASALSILAAGAFVLNLTSFVPLPGAAGGAELGFHALFAMFFAAGLLNASILLWRAATFYLPILVGMLFAGDFFGNRRAAGAVPAPGDV